MASVSDGDPERESAGQNKTSPPTQGDQKPVFLVGLNGSFEQKLCLAPKRDRGAKGQRRGSEGQRMFSVAVISRAFSRSNRVYW